jgi:hypothetical protein
MTGNSEANPLTIAAQGMDTIDGEASVTIESNYGSLMFISDGAGNYSVF